MDNKLLEIQEMLMRQMKRLDNEKADIATETARGNTLSQNATVFIKSINVGFRVIETSEKLGMSKENIEKELGIK